MGWNEEQGQPLHCMWPYERQPAIRNRPVSWGLGVRFQTGCTAELPAQSHHYLATISRTNRRGLYDGDESDITRIEEKH